MLAVLPLLLATGAHGQGADTLSKELALRLFSNPSYPEGDVADIFIGELPESLAAELPLPPNAQVVGALLYQDNRAQVVLDTQQPPERVTDFFKQQQGWRGVGSSESRGFVDAQSNQPTSFCNDDTGRALEIATIRSDRTTDVRLNLSEDLYGLCSEEGAFEGSGFSDAMSSTPMPALTTPENALLSGSGESSDDISAIAKGTLETALSPQEVVAHYAEQLPSQGWQVGERDQAGQQAWQTFSFSDDQGAWQGYLVAIALPDEQAQLFFSVAPSAEATSLFERESEND